MRTESNKTIHTVYIYAASVFVLAGCRFIVQRGIFQRGIRGVGQSAQQRRDRTGFHSDKVCNQENGIALLFIINNTNNDNAYNVILTTNRNS